MKFIVLFEDNPGTSVEVRQAHMAEHLAFLDRNAQYFDSAGPLKNTNQQNAGGIWVLDAEHADIVNKLIKEDPFWPTGLRKSHKVLEWNQVYANGARLNKA